jgi:hypothetical protein
MNFDRWKCKNKNENMYVSIKVQAKILKNSSHRKRPTVALVLSYVWWQLRQITPKTHGASASGSGLHFRYTRQILVLQPQSGPPSISFHVLDRSTNVSGTISPHHFTGVL